MAFKLLRYMVMVLTDYEREQEKKKMFWSCLLSLELFRKDCAGQ